MRDTPTSRPIHPDEAVPEAPGGATVNHVATVATSAALGGAAAGALAGALGGPAGAAIGAAIGAVAAGMAGHAVADSVDAEAEESYWRAHFSTRPYVDADGDFVDYGPAYRYGVDAYVRYPDRSFDEALAELSDGWPAVRGDSRLDWERARHASRDGWERVGASGRRRAGDPPLGG